MIDRRHTTRENLLPAFEPLLSALTAITAEAAALEDAATVALHTGDGEANFWMQRARALQQAAATIRQQVDRALRVASQMDAQGDGGGG